MNIRAIFALYKPTFAINVLAELKGRHYSGWRLLSWLWHTGTFESEVPLSEVERSAAVFLGLVMLGQLALGIGFLVEWARYGTVGAWELGVALILSYSLLWAHVVVVLAWIWNLTWAIAHPKKAARSLVCNVLEWQVRQLRARHHFKVVAVAGSVGKTTTKLAIADLLAGSGLRVRSQSGNYNDRVTVPLVFFGLKEPSLYNVFAWLKVLGTTQSEIAMPYPYDVVVVELGTDGPGQLEQFAYLKPNVAVVTAVAPEHMEYFGTLDAVAAEELQVFAFSKQVLVSADDIAGEYLAGREFADYSLTSTQSRYGAKIAHKNLEGQMLDIRLPKGVFSAQIQHIGEPGAKAALAAIGVAEMLEIPAAAIQKGLGALKPFAGRMQLLKGIKDSKLIDDTYNASPISTCAALDVLYAARTKQRIAILGSMNELGEYAKAAHEEVGAYCEPKKLAVVVTIGQDAKKWLAPVARARGCTVHSFMSPYDAGAYVSRKLEKGAVILAKGSQNGVFAEEALKLLLADPEDGAKLVRQSDYWVKIKNQQFPQ
ncbi:MAG TPA: UDP-N-acetylmuramoyl-tripeptide--D-alanyl-D-alanine ligase [Candidatus Saccharimonadia bacterium]|nr:UDP-N-acetylmuramoyl-tripeptide--D-alanyl-D-alanine ligase [Candidatus Saccharimonadia bacterium]